MRSESQKRANQKQDRLKVQFAVSYRLIDLNEGNRLKKYLETNDLSANSYLKDLIKRDLDSKGITYD